MGARISLHRLAENAGIQTAFRAMDGKRVAASTGALQGILSAMGLPCGRSEELREAADYLAIQKWRRLLDPVQVCWDGDCGKVLLRLLSGTNREVSLALELEDGTTKEWTETPTELVQSSRHRSRIGSYSTFRLALPRLPHGYHRLTAQCGSGRSTCVLISAPPQAFSPEPLGKEWGIFAPAYALKSSGSLGAGSFKELGDLARWMGGLGGSVLGTLPLTATFLEAPVYEPSPYSPASRLFWSEFYIAIEKLPELSQSARAQKLMRTARFGRRARALQSGSYVHYNKAMDLRREILQILSSDFFGRNGTDADFRKYQRDNPRLGDYAAFRAACDAQGASWRLWEPRLRFGKLTGSDYDEATRDYYLYSQWRAEQQIRELAQTCREFKTRLYLDVPVGVHPDSYDLWREGEAFAQSARVGAPPDSFFSKGQDWGFAPLHPQRCRESGYRYVRDYLRFQMRHAAVLRLDHVMGLHRLYWIPPGLGGKDGAYVRYPAEEFYAILNLESHRQKTVVVGENLGTVPPEVNQQLKKRNFRTMYVLPFEQRPRAKRSLPPPPRKCVASINTHDMPTFAAHVLGLDVASRVDMGILGRDESSAETERRARLMQELRTFLAGRRLLKVGDQTVEGLLRACALFLAESESEIVLLTLEDLWGEKQPQNVPGTSGTVKNWSRKMRLNLEEVISSTRLAGFLGELNQARRGLKSAENVR